MIKPKMYAKVAKIISDSRIVLNKGLDDGVKIGDKFLIFSESESTVIDPDSNLSLGKLRFNKATVIVESAAEKYCICVNARSKLGVLANEFDTVSLSSKAPLDVDVLQISGGYEGVENKKITIGDCAMKLDD